jgi:hypothetical protein
MVDGGGQLALDPFGGGKTSCHLRPLKCTWNPPNTHNPSIDGGRLSEASEGVIWSCISAVSELRCCYSRAYLDMETVDK